MVNLTGNYKFACLLVSTGKMEEQVYMICYITPNTEILTC